MQVVGINSKEQKIKLDDGVEIGYDKLLLAPGTSQSFIRYTCTLNTTDNNNPYCYCVTTVWHNCCDAASTMEMHIEYSSFCCDGVLSYSQQKVLSGMLCL